MSVNLHLFSVLKNRVYRCISKDFISELFHTFFRLFTVKRENMARKNFCAFGANASER